MASAVYENADAPSLRPCKSLDGVPMPAAPPADLDLAREARIARRRFYPVTVLYAAYAAELLDNDGRIIKQFSADRCRPFAGDSTRAEIVWPGQSVSEVAGQPVRIVEDDDIPDKRFESAHHLGSFHVVD